MKRSATLLALLTAVPACGTAGSTRTSPPADGGPGDGGSGPFATLSLVAGQPGGLGNVDETGTAARFALPWYVADDVRGHLYVSDGQAIRRVDEGSGAVTTLAGIAYSVSQAGGFVDGVGQAARFDSPSGVACDSAGTVYVADTGNSAVRAIEASTGAVTTIVRAADVDVGPSGAKHFTPVGLAFDGQSSVYVADFGYVASGGQPAGETGGAIYRIALPGAISLVAGSPENGPLVLDGTGTGARFGHLRGIAFDGHGTLYAADGCAIRRVDVASGTVTTLSASACIQQLYGLAFDGVGTLYAADGASAIVAIATATGTTTTVAGQPGTQGAADGVGAAAAFSGPTGLAFGADGTLRIADTGNYTLRALTPSTRAVTTLAGAPSSASTADGTGTQARFSAPQGAANDGSGNLYVVDWNDETVRRVDVSTGAVKTIAGTAGQSGNDDGTGAAARFYEPTWAAYDGAGHVYVSDSGNFAIRRVDVATGAVTTVTGGGFVPGGLAVDDTGRLFVADPAFSSIRLVNLATGGTTAFAGIEGRGCGSADGVGSAASFCGPNGLTYDGMGSLFVTDNQTVRRIDLATALVTTLAGSPGVSGSADGVGAAALFDEPGALAYDGAGGVYVTDGFNATVRRVDLATGTVTTVIGRAGTYGVVLGPIASARLNGPSGLAAGPGGALFITDIDENVVLVAR